MTANSPTHAVTEALRERTFVLGSRQSKLAVWQANHILDLLRERFPGLRYRLETFVTTGDRKLDQPLPEIGGKGLFTEELEEALHAGSIDLVVHSLKDLPVTGSPGLVVAAIPPRANPHDVLVAARPWTLETLPQGARVGTSSLRRAAQLLHARPDLALLPLRGNVDTRIRKTLEGNYDAIILAAAGVQRLGLEAHVREELPFRLMLPAPGQGALAVQCRADDALLLEILQTIDHLPTRQAVTAERAFLQGVGGGCSAPIAAYAVADAGLLTMEGMVASPDGQLIVRVNSAAALISANEPEEDSRRIPAALGCTLAWQALEQGAANLLQGGAAA